ncbi:MAG: FG-GAP-like repeat-containing protein, partial [Planctomycetota bacterium]
KNDRISLRHFGKALGPFRGDDGGPETAVISLETVVGQTYEVEFDLPLLGTWNGHGSLKDRFRVFADGGPILDTTFDKDGTTHDYPHAANIVAVNLDRRDSVDQAFTRVRASFVAMFPRTTMTFVSVTTSKNELWTLDNIYIGPVRSTDGLIARYELSETTGERVADTSGRGNDMRVTGSPSLNTDGLFGSGIRPSAGSYLQGTTTIAGGSPTGFTLAAWHRFDDSSVATRQLLGGMNAALLVLPSQDRLSATMLDNRGQLHTLNASYSRGVFADWTHVAARFDPGTGHFDLFINGARVARNTLGQRGVWGAPDDILAVADASGFAPSETDEMRICDRALSDAELVQLATPPPMFADVTDAAGFGVLGASDFHHGSSVLFADVNADGLLDAFINGDRNASLLVNNGDGTFTTQQLGDGNVHRQAQFADLDNDGDVDLFAARVGTMPGMFFNHGDGTFDVATEQLSHARNAEGAALLDRNRDGFIDAVVFAKTGNHLADAVTTEDRSARIISTTPTRDPVFGLNAGGDAGNGGYAATGDVNNDGTLDMFYHFNGGRLFVSSEDRVWTPDRRGLSVHFLIADKAGASFADYDNDGDLDLFVADYRPSSASTLWQNVSGVFVNVSTAAGLGATGRHRSGAWGDADNDGDLDLYITTDVGPNLFYENNGNGTFTQAASGAEGQDGAIDAVFADVDSDGDLDLAVTYEDAPTRLYRNRTGSEGVVRVRVVGSGLRRTNTSGIGTRITLLDSAGQFVAMREIGTASGFGGQKPLEAHFGGLTPTETYTVRIGFNGHTQEWPVTPATLSTVVGDRVMPGLLVATEAEAP